jgi:hypothetical protein
MNQIQTNSAEEIVSAMHDMTIKSPQHIPRCARIGWSAFGMVEPSCFQNANTTELPNPTYFDEPKTPMGKRTLTSPPTTPKKKQS